MLAAGQLLLPEKPTNQAREVSMRNQARAPISSIPTPAQPELVEGRAPPSAPFGPATLRKPPTGGQRAAFDGLRLSGGGY